MEIKGEAGGVLVVEDFAHHPTAIRMTLEATRTRWPGRKVWAAIEPRSNTMRRKIFQDVLPEALAVADVVAIGPVNRAQLLTDEDRFSPDAVAESIRKRGRAAQAFPSAEAIAEYFADNVKPGDMVMVMSNGSFDGLCSKLLDKTQISHGSSRMTRCAILRCRFIFAACFALLVAARPAVATIEYKISLAHPEKHAFQVEMRVPVDADQRADQRDLIVALPAWNALYQVRDFAYRVRDVRIGNGSRLVQLPVIPYKLDKQTWRIPASSAVDGPIEIEYSISMGRCRALQFATERAPRIREFCRDLMYVPDRRAENVEVKFTDVPSDWKSIAELPSGAAPNSFTAESYDKLVDAPVEIGKIRGIRIR